MSTVTETARANPIGAALVGMGIAWLFAGGHSMSGGRGPSFAGRALSAGGSVAADLARSTGDAIGSASGYISSAGGSAAADLARSAGDAIGSASGYISSAGASAARQTADVVGSAASRASAAVSSGADQAGELAGSIGETLGDKLGAASSRVVAGSADFSNSARSQLGQLLHEQPLLLAAGAFAVGAAMGASLPLTETEERVIGDAAESVMQSREADSIGSRLQNASSAAKEEARRQGLTAEALKTDAGKLRDRVIGGVTGANSPSG
jgi:hypothetical protein